MLRSYLHVWFAILGMTFKGRDLWYVDGFAGPGEYTNYPQGSPLAALSSATSARRETSTRWRAAEIRCFFIEEDGPRFNHLQSKLSALPSVDGVSSRAFHGTFAQGITDLKGQSNNPFSSADPVFAFVDPFGAKGLSFNSVRDLLSHQACEVLVNLDSDGIGRIYQAGDYANHRQLLNDVFGDDSWEREFAGAHQLHDVVRRVVNLYKRKLRELPAVSYAFSFEMRKQHDVFDYHLVFASQHALGLERMKEVMKKLDKTGAYCFSDDHVGQQSLFTFDDPSGPAEQMHKYFAGRSVPYAEVHAYALNESPFSNPKSMLSYLEDAGQITVDAGNQNRRKSTYPERLQALIKVQF